MKIEKCHKCGKPMKLVVEKYEGIPSEAYYCPKCKIKIFTEKQALDFGKKYYQKLLKEKYFKKPIRIGHSYGMTFPKEIVKTFNLDSKDTKLEIRPDFANSKIEISIN